jgi:broad specificity phosphatase PhoE
MVQDGIPVLRGSSDQLGLSPAGVQEAKETGAKLAAKGGLTDLKSSGAKRAQQTAEIVGAEQPNPIPLQQDGDMDSFAIGNAEGQPRALVGQQIKDLVRNNPSYKIPGRGAITSRDGESFDDFRTSRLSALRSAMQELANNPTAKIGRVTHSQVVKLAKGWLKNGTPDDMSVDATAMQDEKEQPGNVARLYPNPKGEWEMSDVDLDSPEELGPGIYLIRHGMTPWNKENYDKEGGDSGLGSLAAIAAHTRALDFDGAKKSAMSAKGLSDEDISNMVDSNLPNAQQAAELPHDQLLGVLAAASPQKRQEYLALAQQRFGDLSPLPTQARMQLGRHLGSIGYKKGDLLPPAPPAPMPPEAPQQV